MHLNRIAVISTDTIRSQLPKINTQSTSGAQVQIGKIGQIRSVLKAVSPDDLMQLDPVLGSWLSRPFGREALINVVLPAAGSTYICQMNIESTGMMVVERSKIAAHIRALVVAPDMRRRGIARTMLISLEDLVLSRDLAWIWMEIPSANVAATKCALVQGYRRFRPQFLRRENSTLLNIRADGVQLERLSPEYAAAQIPEAQLTETRLGDAWAHDLVEADLLQRLMPAEGIAWACIADDQDVGVLHLSGPKHEPILTLWLDAYVWNTAHEIALVKAALDTLNTVPNKIDLHFGSEGHLRASVEAFKSFGFKPVLESRVLLLKRLIDMPNL